MDAALVARLAPLQERLATLEYANEEKNKQISDLLAEKDEQKLKIANLTQRIETLEHADPGAIVVPAGHEPKSISLGTFKMTVPQISRQQSSK